MVHYYSSVATANIATMSYQNTDPISGSESPIPSGFGTQSRMGLPEVLQMCCLSRRSGQITFRSGESYGFIFIQQGRVLHAMCGPLDGEEAIYTMLTWPGGGFTLDEDILPHKKTVTLSWEQLLFEGARRADEGFTGPRLPAGAPVTTAEPLVSTRTQESQPKLTVMRPDLPPAVFELTQEFTHIGRTAGNELCLPYPSVSSRHCIFIISGPDIVLRDLNSSNGTLVNNEAINETVLRPGDAIQIGVVKMKFEAGMKRPKLQGPLTETRRTAEPLKIESSVPLMAHQTVKLPVRNPQSAPVRDDSSFVKGESPISYDNLPKPEVPADKSPWPIIITSVVILLLIGGACYYFFVLH